MTDGRAAGRFSVFVRNKFEAAMTAEESRLVSTGSIGPMLTQASTSISGIGLGTALSIREALDSPDPAIVSRAESSVTGLWDSDASTEALASFGDITIGPSMDHGVASKIVRLKIWNLAVQIYHQNPRAKILGMKHTKSKLVRCAMNLPLW